MAVRFETLIIAVRFETLIIAVRFEMLIIAVRFETLIYNFQIISYTFPLFTSCCHIFLHLTGRVIYDRYWHCDEQTRRGL